MYKWMYDRMVKEYEKESKEELAQRIMAIEEIECSDRCFANHCCAGTAIYYINELFSALDDLQIGFTYEKAAKVYKLSQTAKESWRYTTNGLMEMKSDIRCGEKMDDFKKRVKAAMNQNDSI